MEKYEGPERRKTWLRHPLSTDESPVSETSVLAGVLALGDSTDGLAGEVSKMTLVRRTTMWLMAATFVMTLIWTVLVAVAFVRLTSLADDNHTLLERVVAVTNPEAQKRQQEATKDVESRIVFCINNHLDNRTDGRVPLDSRCPTEYPAPRVGTSGP